jgi:hypothetical protein
MKPKIKLIQLSFFLVTSLTSQPSMGLSRTGSTCPEKFVGIAKQVTSDEAPLSSDQTKSKTKIKVEFDVRLKIKGELPNSRTIEVLKYGKYRFTEGENYLVEMRDGYLCSANEIVYP